MTVKGRKVLVLSIVALFLVLGSGSLLADQKELMDEWARHKRQITEKIVTKLRQEGKLPQYGTIEFTARVKPLPSGELEVTVDSLKVYPKEGVKSSGPTVVRTTQDEEVARKFQEIFRPRNPSPYWTTGTIDIIGGATTSANIRMEKPLDKTFTGSPEESPNSSDAGSKEKLVALSEESSKKESQDERGTTGWWSKFLNWLLGKSYEGGK
ncbi:MAG: hypothetical protein N2260_04195 [Syntrophobacterales bacterium]|nr:hypothetical protein [Syntrophobacterales bacterium]